MDKDTLHTINTVVRQAIRMSLMAYGDTCDIRQLAQDAIGAQATRFDRAYTDTQGFFVEFDNDPSLWIAIRGTEFDNVDDWLTNLDCRKVITCWGRSHKGFYGDAMSVYDVLHHRIRQAAEHKGTIFLTGHSQGGAVAEQLFALIKGDYPEARVLCVPIEAPKGFDDIAAKALGKHGHWVFPVVHNNDIVPHLPPGFRHIKNTAVQYIDRKGKVRRSTRWWSRFWDRLVGMTKAVGKPGVDCLEDHNLARIEEIWKKQM